MSAVAEAELTRKGIEGFGFNLYPGQSDGTAIRIAIESAGQLVWHIDKHNRRGKRAEAKRRLAEVEASERQATSIKAAIAKWEGELTAAVAAHQRGARPIQVQLADETIPGERRVELRLELGTLNAELQKTADALNEKINAGQQELAALFSITCARPQLENAILRTGDPQKLIRLAVLESSIKWAETRATSAAKNLAEITYELERPAKSSWLLGRFGAEEKTESGVADDIRELREPQKALLEAEVAEARRQGAEARREHDRLHAEIVAE